MSLLSIEEDSEKVVSYGKGIIKTPVTKMAEELHEVVAEGTEETVTPPTLPCQEGSVLVIVVGEAN